MRKQFRLRSASMEWTSVRHITRTICFLALVCSVGVSLSACRARDQKEVHLAVAANFTEPAKELAKLFQQKTGHIALLSFGSTGQLFTQITQGAPFDVFIAADQETPRKAIGQDLAVAESLFTYAVGKIALHSAIFDLSSGEMVLRGGRFEKVAIANPATAPYGAAAIEAMKSLGLYEALQKKIVQGNNIAQTFQFVETGNAELGFVALSQVIGRDPKSIWIIPDTLYSPIRQDSVLLNKGAENEAARAFMTFLKSPGAGEVIERYGYAQSP